MSILSSQAEELREAARQFEGYQNGEISRTMREAADTIESLRDRLQELNETCEPTEEYACNMCGQDLVACDVGVGPNGGAIELDPPILFNYCPNCGKRCVHHG